MNSKSQCIRTVANWSMNDKAIAYDHASFDKQKMLDLMPTASPKMVALFDKIAQLDAADMKEHGTMYKHMIFTDIKSSMFGAKLLAAGFAAKGYVPAYSSTLELDEGKLRETMNNNFAVLCSTVIYGKPLGVRFRKRILDIFNNRPDNTHGQLIRFIILDQGYKEGIDLYDIKYVHLFEPLITTADEKQAIGRGTRLCGQKGLEFDPVRGWPLHVIRYEVSVPNELQDKYNTTRMFNMFLNESGLDMRKLVFSSTLEQMAIYGAVDHDLTKHVHNFNIHNQGNDKSSKGLTSLLGLISGGVRKRKGQVKVPRKKKGFQAMREFISERFKAAKYIWPEAKLENQCIAHGGARIVEFNPTQEFVRMFFRPNSSYKGLMLWHSTGTGKCHARDTEILMHDGSIKKVQDVAVGDLLMGDDSTPRRVLSLARGEDELYDVTALDGSDDTYTVNSEHILCLKRSDSDAVIEMEVRDFMELDETKRRELRGYRVQYGIDFEKTPTEIDPYLMGYWVGESDCSYIPFQLKSNDRATRMAVLAGLVDAVGEVVDGISYRFKVKHESLADDIVYVARSLGLWAARRSHRDVVVRGRGLNMLPIKDDLKRLHNTMICDHRMEIAVEPRGRGEYFGFTLDGNNRYVLGSFIVTHNTCTAVATATTSWEREGYNILWVTRHTLKPDIWKNMYKDVCSLVLRGENIDEKEALKKPMKFASKRWVAPMSYKQFSNLVLGKNELYHEMVRRNGKDDILKKTFIIIDEAHKLFAQDVQASERPNVDAIYNAILDSYDKSGAESARVLLMTATPYTSDPMDMIKLVNLMRPRKEAMPSDFADFSATYLDGNGKFTHEGTIRFLDNITGHISYLNREKDARQFSYPIYENVIVPMTRSERAMKQEELKIATTQHDELENNVVQGQTAIKLAKKRAREDLKKLNAECAKLKMITEKKACKEEVTAQMSKFERELLSDLEARVENDKSLLGNIKQRIRSLKKSLKDKKADYSQEAALEVRCGYKGVAPINEQ